MKGNMAKRKSNKSTGRNYKRDTAYENRPAQVKRRMARNRARAKLMRMGRVRKGDKKDVDHKKGVGAGNKMSNLRVVSRSRNRGFRRSAKGKNLGLKRKK